MKKITRYFSIFVAGCMAAMPLSAEVIYNNGILGNSGEQGVALVKFGEKVASGIGSACDKYGSIWDRGGVGVLNRYSPDGRMLATYKIPNENPNRNTDVIVLVEDKLVLRLGKGLYVLPVDAPAGSEAQSLKVDAEKISQNAYQGNVLASLGGEIFEVNLAGEKKPVMTLEKAPDGLIYGPDGGKYVIVNWKINRVTSSDGKVGLEEIGGGPGERMQYLEGYWYGSAWHSTVRRFDKSLQPAPGVVLGGNSGSFIGHVDEQAEIINSRGLSFVRNNLYAVSGFEGILHLLEWKPLELRFEPIRRIGSVVSCKALGLDREGRVWCSSGNWNWDDGPATPLRWGVPAPEMFAITMQDSDSVLGYGGLWGKPSVMFGKMEKEVRMNRVETKDSTLPKEAVAIAISERNKRRVMLVLGKKGEFSAIEINSNGEYQKEGGAVPLQVASPVGEWTSLVATGKDTLLGAGDGNVIELVRDGEGWKESKRWNSWGQGAEEKFGASIYSSVDSGRLWVADSARHRVLCFNLTSGKLLASFGSLDAAGNDLSKLHAPRVIMARGSRAVVFDSGNQRLVKLELRDK